MCVLAMHHYTFYLLKKLNLLYFEHSSLYDTSPDLNCIKWPRANLLSAQ